MLVEGNLAWHTTYGTFRTLRAAYRQRPESVVVRSTEFLFPWEGTLDRALDLRNPLYLTRTTRQQFCVQVRREGERVIFTEVFEWVSGLTGRPHVRETKEMDELSQQYARALDRINLLETRLAELTAENERLKDCPRDPDGTIAHEDAIIAQAEALSRTGAVKVPKGWVVVPREPTDTMMDAASDAADGHFEIDADNGPWLRSSGFYSSYAAMIAFAPTLSSHPRDTNTADAHETGNVSHKPVPPELNIRELISDIEAGRADGFLNDGTDPHGNDLNCPHCGGSGHIDDVNPTPPEGQQPVAWAMAELIRHLTNVIRIADSGEYRDKAGARPSIHPEFENAISALKAAREAEG